MTVLPVSLTENMREMLDAQLAYVTTVTDSTTPHVAPKGSLNAWDDTTLWFHETSGGQTLTNILSGGSHVEVAVVDRTQKNGYRFRGPADVYTEGEPYERAVALRAARGKDAPQAVVLISLNNVESFRPLKNS